MDYMCHLCVRCFETVGELRKHVQDERSQFIRDVHYISSEPQPSISSVLGILLRYVTHSTDLSSEQDLACPEPSCTYVSTDTYQALQRHYMKHVECNVKCPFCSKNLRRVSQAVRHPDECAVRKKQAVAVSETAIALKRPLSDLAFETLRSAQRAKKRRISQGTNLWRSVETDSFAQVSSRVAGDTVLSNRDSVYPSTPALGIATQHHSGHLGKDLGTVKSTSSENPCWHSTTLATNNLDAADHCYTNITTPVQRAPTLSNYTADGVIAYDTLEQDVATTERIFACQPNLFPNNSAAVQRAPTLSSYTADGVIAYDTRDQNVATTERIFVCQPNLFPNNSATVQRAPTLSNYTADGLIAYDTLEQDVATTEMIFACQPNLFPNNSATVQRAPTLSSYTADGVIAYDTLDQDVATTEKIFACQPALFASNSATV